MPRTLKLALAGAYLLHVGFVILLASVPPVSRDALTHHLALPKLWVAEGRMREMPEIVFSYYPQLIDLLYTLPLMAGHDIAAKYMHFAFALLTAGVVFLYVRRRLGTSWAACGGLMFLTIPVILKLSVTVYVDLGLVFFSACALFATAVWLENPRRLRWLLLAGVAAGLSLGTKYSAMVPVFVLGLLLPLFFLRTSGGSRRDQLLAVGYGAVFAALALLVFSPWLLRNYSLTGNPVHPLAQGVFAEATADAREEPRPLGPLLVRKLVYDEDLAYTLLIPFRIFYEGEDDEPKFFDGRLNPLLLLLPLALLAIPGAGRRRHRDIGLFAAYSVLVVLIVFLVVDMRIRWVAAVIPPLVVLAVFSLQAVQVRLARGHERTGPGHALVGALLVAYFLPNVLYAKSLYEKIQPLSYIGGELTRADYIQKYRPEYAAIARANEVVPADKRVLGLHLGDRRYYFSVDVTLDNQLFREIVAAAASGAEIAAQLASVRYSHLVIQSSFFNHWFESLDDENRAKVAGFVQNHLRQLELREGYGLYEIIAPRTFRGRQDADRSDLNRQPPAG